MIISKELTFLLVSMNPAARTAMKLLQIIAFFLKKESSWLQVSVGYTAWYNICLHTHLPSKSEINLTLMAPKSPPTANMETIRDQIIVTICGCGGSPYLSYQLLLMKRWMYCGDRSKLLLNVIQIIETEWRRNDKGDVSHRRRRTQSSDMEADLKASS